MLRSVCQEFCSQGGSPDPHLGGKLGVWWGVSRPTPGGSPGPHLGDLQAVGGGWIPACTKADTPLPQQTATAAGGTHPTGIDLHSFSILNQFVVSICFL